MLTIRRASSEVRNRPQITSLARDRPVHVLDAPLADVHVGNEPGPGLGQLLGLAGRHPHGLDDLGRIDDRLAPEHRVLQAGLRVYLVPLLVQQRHHVSQLGDLAAAQRPDRRYEVGGFRVLHLMIGAVILDRSVQKYLSIAKRYDRSLVGLPEELLRFLARFDRTGVYVFKFLSVYAPCCGHAFFSLPFSSIFKRSGAKFESAMCLFAKQTYGTALKSFNFA